ncbi:MAG: amidohydrolase family protein [Bacteroidales bacterium]
MKEYPNFYCDVSGGSGFYALLRDINASKIFLNKHHKKILFGTDNYINLQHEQLIDAFQLSQEIKKNIFYRNAQKLLTI